MRAHLVLLVTLSATIPSCVDTRFLRGVSCSEDRDCGRSLTCEHGVCGGVCPEDALVDGRCLCPGERIFDCRRIETAPHCTSVCATAVAQCEVAILHDDGAAEQVPACPADDADNVCFSLQPAPEACLPDDTSVVELRPPPDPPPTLLVNCPPPASEDSHFDCAD